MKIFNFYFLLLSGVLFSNYLLAAEQLNKVSNYKLLFSEIGGNTIHVCCEFDIALDSLSESWNCLEMEFGGLLKEYAVDSLKVESSTPISYNYDYEQKKLQINLLKEHTAHIVIKYDFLSASITFTYRGVCEIWETSYGDFYYPFVFGESSLFDITIKVPDTYLTIGGYPFGESSEEQHIKTYHYKTEYPVVSHSFTFAILPDSTYRYAMYHISDFPIKIYSLKDIDISDARITELLNLTMASINFFSTHIAPYESEQLDIRKQMTFIFHKNEYSNRNDLNFIIASQHKFATYPHILPLAHEIGHRWFGEWTLLIKDGSPAAYFIKESLDEYLSILFAKHYYGQNFFDEQLKDRLTRYSSIKGTDKDKPLYKMVFNNSYEVTYCKGPLAIHEVVKIIGEEQWLVFMKNFYLKYANHPNLKYENLIDLLREQNENCADLLDGLVRENIKL
jgi:hypothetical protein